MVGDASKADSENPEEIEFIPLIIGIGGSELTPSSTNIGCGW
jgi:hypothetical protein